MIKFKPIPDRLIDRALRFEELIEGKFVARINRFAAMVELDGREIQAHVPSTARMGEMLLPGNRVWLRPAVADGRKTAYDLALVNLGCTLASVDARLPNYLVHDALKKHRLTPFDGYTFLRRELFYHESRLDLVLRGSEGICLLETKSVTLVIGGLALFPDAPTERGRKHLRSLAHAVQSGYRAAMIFVVQRADAVALSPNDNADPEFGSTLRQAVEGGVEVYAYACKVSMEGVTLAQPLEVKL